MMNLHEEFATITTTDALLAALAERAGARRLQGAR